MRGLGLVVAILALVGCATSTVPRPKLVSAEESAAGASVDVQATAAGLDLSKATTETFIVGYSIDYGYSLYRNADISSQVEPVFVGTAPLMEFNYGYEPLINRPDIEGKHILCECRGIPFRFFGVDHFRVLQARLYAE